MVGSDIRWNFLFHPKNQKIHGVVRSHHLCCIKRLLLERFLKVSFGLLRVLKCKERALKALEIFLSGSSRSSYALRGASSASMTSSRRFKCPSRSLTCSSRSLRGLSEASGISSRCLTGLSKFPEPISEYPRGSKISLSFEAGL